LPSSRRGGREGPPSVRKKRGKKNVQPEAHIIIWMNREGGRRKGTSCHPYADPDKEKEEGRGFAGSIQNRGI